MLRMACTAKIQSDGANGGSDSHPMPLQQQLQQQEKRKTKACIEKGYVHRVYTS